MLSIDDENGEQKRKGLRRAGRIRVGVQVKEKTIDDVHNTIASEDVCRDDLCGRIPNGYKGPGRIGGKNHWFASGSGLIQTIIDFRGVKSGTVEHLVSNEKQEDEERNMVHT